MENSPRRAYPVASRKPKSLFAMTVWIGGLGILIACVCLAIVSAVVVSQRPIKVGDIQDVWDVFYINPANGDKTYGGRKIEFNLVADGIGNTSKNYFVQMQVVSPNQRVAGDAVAVFDTPDDVADVRTKDVVKIIGTVRSYKDRTLYIEHCHVVK